MTNNAKIGVFDSGIGGTTVLREVRKKLPNESFIYLGDSKNCPYGEKTNDELLDICRNNVNTLLKDNVKLIIVACNTATTRVLPNLREEFPNIPFVGVEPAIKLATNSGFSRIILLATPGTAESDRTKELIDENKKEGQEILVIPCPGLADAIESRDNSRVEQVLEELLAEIPDSTRDSFEVIVLGCTHYPIIHEKIQRYFPNAELIDGGKGVAKEVKKLLEKEGLLNSDKEPGIVEYVWT